MVLDIDIWRAAHLLFREHGEDAPVQAATRADALLARGDLDGYATWRRVVRAVEELRATAPAPGSEVH
jgi:hypothetical protein